MDKSVRKPAAGLPGEVSANDVSPATLQVGRRSSAYVIALSCVAAIGGFLFGFDSGVINGAVDALAKAFATQAAGTGFAVASVLLGCALGAFGAGTLADSLGRRPTMLLNAILFLVSAVATGAANSALIFIAARIAGGIAIGAASVLAPMYIAEVAPAHMRGRLVSLNQLTIVIGILAAQLLNMAIARTVPTGSTAAMIAQSWNGQFGWRWMFTLVAAPSVLFFVSAMFVPESPRWLVKNGSPDRARELLTRIGGEAYAATETENIRQTISVAEVSRVRLADLLEPKLLKILLIGCGLAVLQQWSGINVLFNYADNIFKNAGFGVNTTLLFIVITGVVNAAFTFVALGTVDRWGRRGLMLFGCAGIAAAHVLTGLAYAIHLQGVAVLLFVLAAIGCYAMSLAPVTWVVISELFPNRIRGTAISVAVSALWIACFVLTYTFPLLERSIGTGNTFWLYAAICVAGFFFVFLKLPETKNKSLEQIERELAD